VCIELEEYLGYRVVFVLLVLVIIYALTLLDGIQEKATAGIRNKFYKMNGNYTESYSPD
jgi:hypothetical protein